MMTAFVPLHQVSPLLIVYCPLFLLIRIVLSCFYLLIFYFEKFSTWIRRLPFAVYVKLELFIQPFSVTQVDSCYWPKVSQPVKTRLIVSYRLYISTRTRASLKRILFLALSDDTECIPCGPYVTFLVRFDFLFPVHRPSIFSLEIVERAYEIEPTGDRKRKGVGWGWRKESMKKNVFLSSFYLSVSFLFFSRASWSFSRAHQIVQNKKNVYLWTV